MKNYEVVLEKQDHIGTQAIQLTLKFQPSVNFEFKPGQYIWLILPKLDFPDPRGERRAFSVTSSNLEKNQITVLVRVSESGFKKTLFNLPQNSPLQILGPFGSSYVINPDLNQTIVMIAGGIGIAPFSSNLRSLQTFTTSPKLKVVYCSTSAETSCFTSDLDQICGHYNIPVTKHLGDFRDNILPPGIDYVNDVFFVCGPELFVSAVCEALFKKQIPLSRIHLEQYYPALTGNLTEQEFVQRPGEKNIMLQAVQDSKNHVIITDANGKIVFANKTAEKNTGFTFDEMRGNTPRLWGGLMSSEFYKIFWQKKHDALGYDGELTNRRKNGEKYHVIAHISAIVNENKTIIGFIGTEEDITEKKLIEEQLKTQNEELKVEKIKDEALLANIGDGVVSIDSTGSVLLINPAALKMLRFSQEELLNKNFVEVVSAEDENGQKIPAEKRLSNLALKSGQILSQTYTYIRKDGTKFVASIIASPIKIQGIITGTIISLRDVTIEKQIDKAKTEFISLASHQLRTPLSTINWYTESLLSGESGVIPANQKQFLDEIYTASQRMVTLVNSLLNVSRIELGTFVVEPVLTDIVQLLQSEISELDVQTKLKNIQIILSKNTDKLEIPIDVKLMQMVLQNIVSNSIKYSPEHTTINIGLNKTDQEFTISIMDQGMGIPKDDQPKIFTKLYRAVNAREKISDGNGLGLYLAKMIIDQSGGKLWFESLEGKGTTFFIKLPLSGMIKKEGTKTLS